MGSELLVGVTRAFKILSVRFQILCQKVNSFSFPLLLFYWPVCELFSLLCWPEGPIKLFCRFCLSGSMFCPCFFPLFSLHFGTGYFQWNSSAMKTSVLEEHFKSTYQFFFSFLKVTAFLNKCIIILQTLLGYQQSKIFCRLFIFFKKQN